MALEFLRWFVTTTPNTTYTVGHTILSTLFSVGELDEYWMKNG
jgi:hypothetical protein